jgi:hypothetical protein
VPADRFLVLVPVGEDWHVATRDGALLTTTERTQIPLGRIEGKRPPAILANRTGGVETRDLADILTDQAAPAPPAEPPAAASARPARAGLATA